jgi:pyruvate/2-oxoglutarate/acetoin dehydrogenase E1 component
MNYRDEITRSMQMLGENPSTIFLGQSVLYRGTSMFSTLKDVPKEKIIEFPVAEELQLGVSTGLALNGYIPVSLFPRMDFLLRAFDQLINHLDKIALLSEGRFKPKVIIRTSVGGIKQLNPGLQHVGNYIEPLRLMLKTIPVIALETPESIYPAYEKALKSDKSTILVEYGDLYD